MYDRGEPRKSLRWVLRYFRGCGDAGAQFKNSSEAERDLPRDLLSLLSLTRLAPKILLWPIGAFDRPLASNSIRFAFELSIAAKAGTAVTSHLCVFVLVAHNGFVSASYVVAGLPALALLC